LSLALCSACLPPPAHAKKGKHWKYDPGQCGLLLSVASSADADGSGGLDSAEAGAFHADLLAKGAATESDGGPEDWWFDESVCACRYTYKLDWACCDDTASVDDLKLDGDEGGAELVFPFGEIPLPDYVVSSNPGNEDWTGKRTDFERKFCKEMFKIVEKGGGSYDLDMSLGAQPTPSPTARATTLAPVTDAPTLEPTARATTLAPVTYEPTYEPTPSPTARATTLAPVTEEPTPSPTLEATTLDAELDQRPASLSSINDGNISNVRSAAGSDGGGVSAGAFVGIALATLLVLLLASALIVRRRRRRLREEEDAVRHEALNDSTEMGGGDGPAGGELWHDGDGDGGAGGGDGARTSSAAGTLAAMGVASTVATRLTTGESEVMLTERRGWSRNEPDV